MASNEGKKYKHSSLLIARLLLLSASMDKLLVTGLGPDITKEMIEAFFEARKMKIASVSVPENGEAIVELITSDKDIRSFLIKKHKIHQCVFNIELMENDQISDDLSSTIEVSYPEDLDTGILVVYFQGPGSGGNDDKEIEWLKVIEPGKCHIKFESDGDAIAVSAEPKQEFMGNTLNVQRCLSSLPVKAKHDLDKLLVKGVPESVNEDVLTTYLDGRLDLEHETDYTVKLKNSCAVIIFTEQYSVEELNSFCEKISQKKLKGCVVSAERCNSIDVSNILSSDKPASTSSGTSLCSSEEDGYETDKLLIKDIPEAVSSEEVLTVFIDGRLDLEHEIDYNLIMLKDTCAVIVFKRQFSIKELNAFSENLSKGRIKGKTISAHKCQINSPETIEICSILAAPPKQEYETDQLLITEIPDSVSEMYLATFLDGYMDLDHESDYTFKMKRTCALVKFSQDYSVDELSAFCENISSHKLKEETVTVEKCRVNCSILVTKIGNKEFKSQDGLEMYFHGKKSGAGKGTVESIVMLSADRAKVTFKEPSVVVAVLSKDHTKLGPNVSVVACSPLDGLDGSFEEKEADPSPLPIDNTPPKTITVHIDRLLAKFLQQKSELLEALGREIQMSVLLNDGIIELKPTESTPMDYFETSSDQFQSLLSSKVCKADINIPPEAVKDLYPMLGNKCTSENMPIEFNGNVASVAGLSESVLDLQKMAEQYCSHTIMTTGQHTLTGEDYRYFTRCRLKQVEIKYKGLKIEFTENKDSFVMSFSGSVHDVEQFQQALPSLLAHAKVPVALSILEIAFLHKGKGFDILKTIIGHASVLSYFSADRLTLSLLCSHDDAQHAEAAAMKIGKEIVEKELELPPYFFPNVADSTKFTDFQQKTSKHYAFLCKFDEMKMKLVCREEILAKLSHLFEKFAAEECAITEKIVFKKGVWRLLNSALKAKWDALKEEMTNNEVSIVTSSKPTASKPFVKVKGEHGKVEKIKAKILELQKSIKEERITRCRPGMVRYFLKDTQGQILLRGIESNAKVCIEVEVETDEADELETSIDTGRSGTNFKRICSANTKGRFTISVYVGDITVFNRAEVIVNAANENLAHGGGVAGAIFDRGGQVINKDSNDHVKKYGQVNTGSAVIFHRVGNLPPPYKAIVHAVGPRWSSYADSHDKEIALLRKSVKNSLKLSRDYNSIAIPAISGGIFGFPPHICAGAVVKGVVEYLEADPDCSLTDINFVIFQNNVDVFKKAMNDHFANVNAHDDVPTASLSPITTPSSFTPAQATKTRRKRGSIKPNLSLESMDLPSPNIPLVNSSIASSSAPKLIKVTKGDILKNQCEVLVNTTDQHLGFGGSVLKAAGQGLADECEEIPKPIQHGDIVTTGAHKLTSEHMLHVVLPGYNGTQAETMLRSVVKKCLQECTRLKAKSISIPSIGAGNLGYPADVVATCLLEETTSYMSKNKGKTSLQLVHFVIFDGTVHQAFQDRYSQMESGKNATVVPQPKPSSAINNSNSPKSSPHAARKKPSLASSSVRSHDALAEDTTCSFSLENGLLLQIVQGDITKERVDVVVNTTNTEMQLTGAGVAGALVKQGGPGLKAACDSLRKQNIKAGESKVVETPCEAMGQLKCKSIFHIVFEGKDQRKLVKTILSCLDRAEKLKYTSIALPAAIGTGNMAYSTSLAAEGIVKALKQFTQRKPRHVKQIRMVIFQSQMFQQFTDAFKNIEKTEGILNYIYDKRTKLLHSFGSLLISSCSDEEEEGMEMSPLNEDSKDDDYGIITMPDIPLDSAEVTLCIYGESEAAVKRAVKQFTSLIDNTFIKEEVDNVLIIELPNRNAISALQEFAKKHAVDIDIDTDPSIHTIKLHGCQSDVLEVKDKVRDVLAEMNQWKTKEEAAATVCKHVKWVRQCSDGPEDYDEMTSFAIEQAYQQKKDIYSHDCGDENFKVDFSKMEDIDGESGEVFKLERIDFSLGEKPSCWNLMPKDSNGREAIVHLVPLKQTSAEYKNALGQFNMTMQSKYLKIVSIERIQNPVQYGQYVARKKEMDKRNPPGYQNERWLFHGTNPNVIENINTQGFNRSFKNVSLYGQGVYFARDASYSHGYAQPDPDQHHYVYLTRVLTGEFTVGQQNMLVPPPKPNQQNSNVLYDSTVDRASSPIIFVVYNDAQAYAAYLITYQ